MGKHISFLELNKVVVEILRSYDVNLADPHFEMKLTNRWFLKPEDLPCYFRKRERRFETTRDSECLYT